MFRILSIEYTPFFSTKIWIKGVSRLCLTAFPIICRMPETISNNIYSLSLLHSKLHKILTRIVLWSQSSHEDLRTKVLSSGCALKPIGMKKDSEWAKKWSGSVHSCYQTRWDRYLPLITTLNGNKEPNPYRRPQNVWTRFRSINCLKSILLNLSMSHY